jgi:hypothetical protein
MQMPVFQLPRLHTDTSRHPVRRNKLKAVRNSEPSKNVHEVRQFMGLSNFFRSHKRNFGQIGSPLNKLI